MFFFDEILPIAREWAILLLVLESLLLLLVPLFVLYRGTGWLRRVVPGIAPSLRSAHTELLRISGIVERAMAYVRAPFVWAAAVAARVSGAIERARRVLLRGR
jgi:hypothetical protein